MKRIVHYIYLFLKGHRHFYGRELDVLSGVTWPYKQPHIRVCSCGRTIIVER